MLIAEALEANEALRSLNLQYNISYGLFCCVYSTPNDYAPLGDVVLRDLAQRKSMEIRL